MQSKDGIIVYDELLNQFKDSEEVAIKEQMVKALRSKEYCLEQLGWKKVL
jgi:hypothetical protein